MVRTTLVTVANNHASVRGSNAKTLADHLFIQNDRGRLPADVSNAWDRLSLNARVTLCRQVADSYYAPAV